MPILTRETSIYPAELLSQRCNQGPDMDRRWWTVYTRSRAEKAVARQLLANQLPFYLPLVTQEQFSRGRRLTSHMPLFTGYLFLFGSNDERVKMLSNSGNRVSRVLDVDDQAQLLHDLRSVQRLIDTDAPLTVERRLLPGQPVRVKRGALAGLEGTIVRRHKSKRLVVNVNYLQQGVSVEIDDFMGESI